MNEKKKHELYLWGGLIAGGVALFALFSHRPTTQTQAGRTTAAPAPRSVPNPDNSKLYSQFIAARESAIGTYDQSALSEKGIEEQANVTNNETAAQKMIAFRADATQLKTVGLETAAEEAITSEQDALERTLGMAQIGVQQQQVTNQGNQWWQNILGGIASFLPGLFGGFSSSSVFTPEGPSALESGGEPLPPVYTPPPSWPGA